MPSSANLKLLIPGACTGACIATGFCALVATAAGRLDTAVHLLVLAVFLDLLDGRLARAFKATSRFGQQMDSLSDVMSFGAVPALLVHEALLRELGPWGVAVSVTYLLSGVFRLARFNLISDVHEKARRTVGVPIPVGAGYLMAVVLMREQISAFAGAAVVLAVAVLMASRVRLPDLKGKNLVTGMIVVGIFSYLAVVVWPSWTTVSWWNLWNVLILFAARREDRQRAEVPAAVGTT